MKTDTTPSNAFMAMLNNLRGGQVADDLSERLTDLVAGVRDAGKVGVLTLKIKVAPASAGDKSKLLLTESISVSRPEKVRPASLFFASEDNALLRDDPNQRELELRAVPESTKPSDLREVPAAPAPRSAVA